MQRDPEDRLTGAERRHYVETGYFRLRRSRPYQDLDAMVCMRAAVQEVDAIPDGVIESDGTYTPPESYVYAILRRRPDLRTLLEQVTWTLQTARTTELAYLPCVSEQDTAPVPTYAGPDVKHAPGDYYGGARLVYASLEDSHKTGVGMRRHGYVWYRPVPPKAPRGMSRGAAAHWRWEVQRELQENWPYPDRSDYLQAEEVQHTLSVTTDHGTLVASSSIVTDTAPDMYRSAQRVLADYLLPDILDQLLRAEEVCGALPHDIVCRTYPNADTCADPGDVTCPTA